jgi:hypothetical protein
VKRLALLLSLCLVGCSAATQALRSDYTTYNQTIQFNQSQQMLLNLVRLKYRELPLFLKIGALSASYSFEASAGADFGSAGGAKIYGLDLGSSFSTRPTITYTPLEGDTFVKQVLSEIEPDAFVLLVRSGWRVDLLCHVLVERIGESVNNSGDPSYPEFLELARKLRAAQNSGELQFVILDDEVYLQVLSDRTDIEGSLPGDHKGELLVPFEHFQLRSFLDVMYSLGQNTLVPEEHLDQVKDGTRNEWLQIQYTSSQPDDALVWVKHNGYYFSIRKNDIQSKDTFSLVKLLYQMQAGDVATVQPILTLPVAQP